MLSIFTSKDVRRFYIELMNTNIELKNKINESVQLFNNMMSDLDDFIPEEVKIIAKDSFIINIILETFTLENNTDTNMISMLKKEDERLQEEITEYEHQSS
jgi:hypothetical protein